MLFVNTVTNRMAIKSASLLLERTDILFFRLLEVTENSRIISPINVL